MPDIAYVQDTFSKVLSAGDIDAATRQMRQLLQLMDRPTGQTQRSRT